MRRRLVRMKTSQGHGELARAPAARQALPHVQVRTTGWPLTIMSMTCRDLTSSDRPRCCCSPPTLNLHHHLPSAQGPLSLFTVLGNDTTQARASCIDATYRLPGLTVKHAFSESDALAKTFVDRGPCPYDLHSDLVAAAGLPDPCNSLMPLTMLLIPSAHTIPAPEAALTL